MWITSNKNDPAYRFLKLYNKQLAEQLRQEAEKSGRAVWVSSQNIDDIEIEQLKKEAETATGERLHKIDKRLRELLPWWELDF